MSFSTSKHSAVSPNTLNIYLKPLLRRTRGAVAEVHENTSTLKHSAVSLKTLNPSCVELLFEVVFSLPAATGQVARESVYKPVEIRQARSVMSVDDMRQTGPSSVTAEVYQI